MRFRTVTRNLGVSSILCISYNVPVSLVSIIVWFSLVVM